VLDRELGTKSEVPQGLIKAFLNYLGKHLDGWLEKLPIMSDKRPLEKLKDKISPHAYYRLQKYANMGGKVASLVFVVASALLIAFGLPLPGAVLTILLAAVIKLLADLLSGDKVSTAFRKFGTNIALGATLGSAISYVDAAYPSIREFITNSWQALGFGSEQAAEAAVAAPPGAPSTQNQHRQDQIQWNTQARPCQNLQKELLNRSQMLQELTRSQMLQELTRSQMLQEFIQLKEGDTLGAIAQQHGVTAQQLWDANRDTIGTNPHLIRPGLELQIPQTSPEALRPDGTSP
jgi:hypothetical protein